MTSRGVDDSVHEQHVTGDLPRNCPSDQARIAVIRLGLDVGCDDRHHPIEDMECALAVCPDLELQEAAFRSACPTRPAGDHQAAYQLDNVVQGTVPLSEVS